MSSRADRERMLHSDLDWHLHKHHGHPKPGPGRPLMRTLRAMHRREHVERDDLDHTHKTGSGASSGSDRTTGRDARGAHASPRGGGARG